MGRPHRALAATAMATLALAALANPVSNVDVLSRCQTLLSSASAATAATKAASFITLPTSQLPTDVAEALATHALDWAKLSDVMRVGVLWVHGYVMPGGGGGAPVKVYTACDTANAREEPLGWFMDEIALPRDRFAAAKCENNTCGTWFQATNKECAATVAADLLCAVDAAPTALPGSNESFWSYTGNDSTDEPFPQLYTHALPVTNSTAASAANASTKTLNVISIHMAASTSGGPSCGNTGVEIVPCLPVADIASKSELNFCRPKVDASPIAAFLDVVKKTLADATTAPAASTLKTDEKTSSGGLSTGAIIGIAGGALVVLGLLAFYFFRSKNSRSAGTGNDPEYPGFGRKSSNGNGARSGMTSGGNAGGVQGFGANRNRGIHRQGTSNTFPLMDSANDTVISTDYVGGNDGLDEDSRQRPFSRRLLQSQEGTSRTRGSSVGGSSRSAMYGKSVDEYCEESDIIREFVTDPQIKIRRIPYEELTILRILSKGSYGEVFLGQLETRHIAMKRLLPEKKHLTKSIEQFMGEIQIMCNLEHRNIVTFVGVSWDYLQNISVIVEYMDNGDLAEVLAKSKNKFSWPKEKISISMDVAEGLVYLHSMRPVIVHRDLKSKNVLLNKRGQAKLSDFGVSRKTTVNETMTSGVGTLLWTAPEIIEGRKYSEKADIFSLGVVLSEIDTCEEPYSTVKNEETGERLPGMQIVQMVRLGELKINFRDDCPPKLRELAQQCTSLDPDKRPTSMEVAYTLKSIIAPSLRASAST